MTYMMIDADVVACSPASVYRVLKAAGMIGHTAPPANRKGTGFKQPLSAHQHWHLDVSYLNIAGTFYFMCSVLDGYSRYLVHHEIREKMEEMDVEIILQRARELFPEAAPRIITDNGPQFIARDFKEFIRIAGMTHVRTSPYYPQSNGKIERWHQTIKGDCIRIKVPLSLDEARRLTTEYVEHYNTVRLHSAIGYITPLDKLLGRQQEIFDERDRKLAAARQERRCRRQAFHEQGNGRRPIDFAAVRDVVRIGQVLELIGFEPRRTQGDQQRGGCPLHGSRSARSTCFSVHLEDHTFRCFKCGRGGNVIDLWSTATKQLPYDAVIDLCGRLNIPVPYLTDTEKRNPYPPRKIMDNTPE